jgi:hypothetical protein
MQDVLTLLVILFVLIAVVVIFIRVALRIRRNGGSLTTTVFAATYDFYNKDKRKAIEVISEQKAGKKMEEQASDEPQE